MDEPVDKAMERLHTTLVEATDVQQVLEAVAHACAAVIAGEAGETTVTLRRDGRASAVAWTGERARRCDEVEYASGGGPCLTALDVAETILVHDVASESRWPAWRDAALESGFVASAAFPVRVNSDLEVSLNAYSDVGGAFDDATVARAQRLATELRHVLDYSLRLADLATTTADLRTALESRAVIDQAIGMVMAQNRCSAEEALALLRRASQGRNVRLRDLAHEMVRRVGGAEPPVSTFEPRNG
ncbi:ANTAR domain-containing protein [Cellulomonas sp. JZ18]|uniref:GAF and ANTAR domain-containing protein n=1 Tax=Cellulomonas sp. JZ18 TaxID=2654191 RepID=UPI0012D49387|nr:GAF and ANTAR domain-containing protein [Cellulomonas sp. JZ18]QGQ19449.1 ANTAR domain-containing protein [Cellulomonas sp. JZ18]